MFAMASSGVGVLRDEDKHVLLERYLDIVWIDDVAEVKCVRCDRVPIHHYVSNCQHIFCRNCRTVFSDGGQWRCPKCKEYVTQLSDQDWQLEDTIYQLTAHCPNKKYGCHYQGHLKTIPGHLKMCEDTRQAALPVEIREDTLDPLRSEVKELKDKNETNWNELKARVAELSTDQHDQKKKLANLEPLLKENNDELSRDLKLLKWDLLEHKEQMANVKLLIKDMKDLQDKEAKDAMEMQQLRTQLQQQQTVIETNTAQAKQIERLNVTMSDMQSEAKDLKENWESKWKDMKRHMDKVTKDLDEQKQQFEESKARDASEIQKLTRKYTKVELMSLTFILISILLLFGQMMKQFNSAEEQVKIMKQLQDKEERDALEMQHLRSLLQQQHTLIDTHSTKFCQMMEQLNSVDEQVKSVKDDADEIEETLLHATQIDPYSAVLNKWMMKFPAKTQMPHDALHSMTLVYKWDIREIEENRYGMINGDRESEVFVLRGYQFGAKAIIDVGGQINLQLIDYKGTKSPIDTKSMPKFTWVIESQSQTTQEDQLINSTQQHSTDGIRTTFITFDQSLDYGEYIYSWPSWSISSITRPPYLVSDQMKLKLYVEPPSMARSFFSNNGILLWRLDNYKMRKPMQMDGIIYLHESPYFYTSPHGYRVLVRLRLNQENVNGGVWFVTGEFDSSLTQRFSHRLTVTLFSHTDQSKNLVISQQGNTADHTYFDFTTASASMLESGGYVADDSMLIKAVIEPM